MWCALIFENTSVIINVQIEESWKQHVGAEFDKPYFANLVNFVRQEYATTTCYPPGREIFNAFNLCPFDQVKVVIIGQDPYHEPGQAEGLCFSVKDGVMPPPSLINIFKEIQTDLGKQMPSSGSLRRWAEQGVLLLNATLTVSPMPVSVLLHATVSMWCICCGVVSHVARRHS